MTGHKKIVFTFILLTLFSNLSGGAEKQAQNKNVLILFSFVPSTPAYHIIEEGIRQKLTDNFGDGFDLHIEYLETEQFPPGEYPEERFKQYNKKYQNFRLDLLICVGPNIISTIRRYASKKLLSIPAISIDYDLSSFGYPAETSLNDHTAVFPIRPEPVSTISEALALFPDTRYIHVVSGVSNTDKIFLSIAMEAAKKIARDRTFFIHTDISMDDALKIVSHLPEKSIIFIPYFIMDNNRVAYYNPEAIRLISKAGNAPVFTLSDMGIGDGSVGGYIFNFQKIALKSGEVAVRILKGTDPASIKISKNDYYDYLFDWRELKRWKIENSDKIPKGSTILYKETTVFSRYRLYFFLAIILLILETFLVVSLVMMIRKQRKTTRMLIESENKYRELIHEDRTLRIGHLSYTLAHELNQPLAAIQSMSQAGLRFIDSGNPEPSLLKEIFQKIEETNKRTSSVLASIRGMMKLEVREKEKVNLNTLVDELLNICRSNAIEPKIKWNVRLLNEPVYVVADSIQIQQVLLNIVINASQSMALVREENKIITITESIRDDQVVVSVCDRGKGIDEDLKDKLFRPFKTSRKEGSGVGLAISRSIIEDHQGKIWAENIPGGGADFSFSLKICNDET